MAVNNGHRPAGFRNEHLAVEVDLDRLTCYALVVNHRAPVRSITIQNLDGLFSGTLTIVISLEWVTEGHPTLGQLVHTIDTPSLGQIEVIEFGSMRLDDSALASLTEEASAQIVVTVRDSHGHELFERFEILILARDQWRLALQEHTAAFVPLMHPGIMALRACASELLELRTGNGALEGYRRGSSRAFETAQAIYDSLIQHLRGSPVDATWGADLTVKGGRIESFDTVFASKAGTPLELALLFAAVLHSAGIAPLIFFCHGRVFAGMYLDNLHGDQGWNQAFTTDVASIIDVVERGVAIPIDTTALNSTSSFADAIRQGKMQVVEHDPSCTSCALGGVPTAEQTGDGHIAAVLDFGRARAQGLVSLPLITMIDGIEVTIVDQGQDHPPLIGRLDPVTRQPVPSSVPLRIQKWQTALLDLTRRSPLIAFRPHEDGISLQCAPQLLGPIEDYLSEGGQIGILGSAEHGSDSPAYGHATRAQRDHEYDQRAWTTEHVIVAEASAVKHVAKERDADQLRAPQRNRELVEISVTDRARELIRKSRTAEAESGVNNLHLAMGHVSWPFDGNSDSATTVISPLFLMPIRMQVLRGGARVTIHRASDSVTSVNFSLLEVLRKRFNLRLTWFDGKVSDDAGLDVQLGLDELRREFEATGLVDKGFTVEAAASIGVFPFQKVRLWKDLTDHWQEFLANPVVSHLVRGDGRAFRDPADPKGLGAPTYDDLSLLNPRPADGAQTRAIVRALAGQSYVLEGPPGTGKSQTITNLLANALAQGMKVLFVAEKPEARSVVLERLQTVGLAPFCLDLHDQGSSPRQVKDQLTHALAFVPEEVDVRWRDLEERYRIVVEALMNYRENLHGKSSNGLSYFDCVEALLALGEAPVIPIGPRIATMPTSDIEEIRQILLELPPVAQVAQARVGHPWAFSSATDFEDINFDALGDQIVTLNAIGSYLLEAPDPWRTAFIGCASLDDAFTVLSCARIVQQGSPPISTQWREIRRSDWQLATTTSIDLISQALDVAAELNIPATLLTQDLTERAKAVASAAAVFARNTRASTRPSGADSFDAIVGISNALGDLADIPGLSQLSPVDAAATVSRLAQASSDFHRGMSLLTSCDGLDLPVLSSAIDDHLLSILRQRIQDLAAVAAGLSRSDAFATAIHNCLAQESELPHLEQVDRSLQALLQVGELTGATSETWASWIANRGFLEAINASIPTWTAGADTQSFIALRRWTDLLRHLQRLETPVLAQFRTSLVQGVIDSDHALASFDRALLSATLTIKGEEYNFDVFDSSRQDTLVKRFAALTSERELLAPHAISERLHLNRDDTSWGASLADLRVELSASRKGAKSVRNLISKYPHIISQVTPCFLMSPDSVAKFIPPDSIHFDLVVFDEASQIRVEEAIGSMGRGRSVVIVGDSRQMPPSTTFLSHWGDQVDDEYSLADWDGPITEAESILEEAVDAGLPREMLNWHYRSCDEVLISFSNERYYDRMLATFPSPFLVREGVGIDYRRINGQFIHGTKTSEDSEVPIKAMSKLGPIHTNPIEADAMVAEVLHHVQDPARSQLSLGIVTLNRKQADLIESKLRECNNSAVLDLLDHSDPDQRLWVLNLESVQGRERDIILLGTSFSNTVGTDTMPLQFGPLTMTGGERRLNVAITRARRQMIIFSSFDPIQLRGARSLGMRHLYEYLSMAQKANQERASHHKVPSFSPHLYAEQIAQELVQAGLTAQVGYGLSTFKIDIVVGTPEIADRWLVAVLLDGRNWASRPLVFDRDGMPMSVLKDLMGWPAIARVWLPAWQRDSQAVIGAITHLVAQASSSGTPPIPGPA